MKSDEDASRKSPLDNGPILITLLLIVDSLHFVFARLLHDYHMPPAASAFYVLGSAAFMLFIAALIRRRLRFQVLFENLPFFISIAFMVAVSTVMNYSAVAFIDPGTASMLGKTSVLFGLAFGLFWLKEKLTRIEILGSGIAVIGVFVIAFQPTGDLLELGSLIVLGSTFLYSLHAAVVKRYGGELDMLEFLFFRLAITAAFILMIAVAQGAMVWPTPQVWLMLLLVGAVDVVISRGLYYLALRKLNLSFHSIILTASPAVTILWSLALFSDLPSIKEFLGGAAVLAGVLVVTISQTRQEATAR